MSIKLDKDRYVIIVEERGHIRTSKTSRWGNATAFARQEWQTESVDAVRVYDTHMDRTWHTRIGSVALHCEDL